MIQKHCRRLCWAVVLIVGALASPALASEKGRIQVVAGLGYMTPQDDVPGTGWGGFGELAYSLPELEWLRFYAGGVWAGTDTGSCNDIPCDVSAKIFFAGTKLRLTAPVPYVRPYLDIGFGLSAGTMIVQSGSSVDSRTRGLMFHIPFCPGLQIGNRRVVDLGMHLLFHPTADGIAGAALAVGIAFDI